MKGISFGEFKPTVLFLVRFIGLYLLGNFLYGLYVTAYEPRPDPVTQWVTHQTGAVISACGWPVDVEDHPTKSTTRIKYNHHSILAVYEGCNGVNTMIIFAAFIFAFGPISKRMLWFIPLGIVIIHLANLVRITLLFFVAEYRPDFMYFIHKYVFTASLYAVIFMLWVWWVRKFATRE